MIILFTAIIAYVIDGGRSDYTVYSDIAYVTDGLGMRLEVGQDGVVSSPEVQHDVTIIAV